MSLEQCLAYLSSAGLPAREGPLSGAEEAQLRQQLQAAGWIDPRPLSLAALLAEGEACGSLDPLAFRHPIVVNHNRKAGGTSLVAVLTWNGYAKFDLRHHTDALAFNYASWPLERSGTVCDLQQLYAVLLRHRESGGRLIPVFPGHIAFTHALYDLMPGAYVSLTCLRDPVELMLSFYRFTRRMPGAPHHRAIVAGAMGPAAFAAAVAAQHGPGEGLQYTHFRSSGDGPDFGPAQAAENLRQRTTFFVLVERMAESLYYLSRLLPLAHPLNGYYCNRSDAWPLMPDDDGAGVVNAGDRPDAAELERLRAVLAPDLVFYDRCRALYAERTAQIRDHFGLDEAAVADAVARLLAEGITDRRPAPVSRETGRVPGRSG